MRVLYILVASVLIILEGAFPWHWHGFINKNKKYKDIISEVTPLFVVREYFLNISLAVVGWVAGYYLLFDRRVFHGNSALLITTFVVFLLGATGYLPNFVVNKIGSLKG